VATGAVAAAAVAMAAALGPPLVVVAPAKVLRALEAAGSEGEAGEGGFGKVVAAEPWSLAARWERVAVIPVVAELWALLLGLEQLDAALRGRTAALCPATWPPPSVAPPARSPSSVAASRNSSSSTWRISPTRWSNCLPFLVRNVRAVRR